MSLYPNTTWHTEQASLMPDIKPRLYATVSNMVTISDGDYSTQVPVVVPTILFVWMRDVFKIPVGDEVELYLVRDGSYWVFGMMWGEKGIADLWAYTSSKLPAVFNNALQSIA